jgi:hypothetical protein
MSLVSRDAVDWRATMKVAAISSGVAVVLAAGISLWRVRNSD